MTVVEVVIVPSMDLDSSVDNSLSLLDIHIRDVFLENSDECTGMFFLSVAV